METRAGIRFRRRDEHHLDPDEPRRSAKVQLHGHEPVLQAERIRRVEVSPGKHEEAERGSDQRQQNGRVGRRNETVDQQRTIRDKIQRARCRLSDSERSNPDRISERCEIDIREVQHRCRSERCSGRDVRHFGEHYDWTVRGHDRHESLSVQEDDEQDKEQQIRVGIFATVEQGSE